MKSGAWVLLLGLVASGGCAALGTAPVTQVSEIPGTKRLLPSNHRDWLPNQAKLATCEIEGDQITIRNVRNTRYVTEEIYVVDHYDMSFKLGDLQTVDFLVVPFTHMPALAHTMISFGLADGRYVAVSVESRRERGEQYTPWRGALREYELIYVVADERDVIQLRTQHYKADVYLYPGKAEPEQVQALFLDVMGRVNQLAKHPEFYDVLTNNCTTNLARHVNQLRPGRIPIDYRVLLTGLSDHLAYDLGLIDTDLPFEQLRQAARINSRADRYSSHPEFSQMIRR